MKEFQTLKTYLHGKTTADMPMVQLITFITCNELSIFTTLTEPLISLLSSFTHDSCRYLWRDLDERCTWIRAFVERRVKYENLLGRRFLHEVMVLCCRFILFYLWPYGWPRQKRRFGTTGIRSYDDARVRHDEDSLADNIPYMNYNTQKSNNKNHNCLLLSQSFAILSAIVLE
jgi:hypothetical protein